MRQVQCKRRGGLRKRTKPGVSTDLQTAPKVKGTKPENM